MSSKPEMPWEKMGWDDEFLQIIYRSLGDWFSMKFVLDRAAIYYGKSLKIKNNDAKALSNRSYCNCAIANVELALTDIVKATGIVPNNAEINLQHCEVLYDSNLLEDSFKEANNNVHLFSGRKLKKFVEKTEVLGQNFKDSLGEGLGPFLRKYNRTLDIATAKLEKERIPDTRLLWRKRKDLNKCDVLSVEEIKLSELHPREIKRLQLCFKVYNQVYMQRSWVDVEFLTQLLSSRVIKLKQTPKSSETISNRLKGKYDIVRIFTKMMQVRSPMYNEKCRIYGKKETETHELLLFKIQGQTRRIAIKTLKLVNELRAKGDLTELSLVVENYMGTELVVKTQRVFPWIFQYMNEIYNILALAFMDKIEMPDDEDMVEIATYKPYYQLMILFDAYEKEKVVGIEYDFGDRSTYQEADVPDYVFFRYKKKCVNFETRLKMAKYSIEKCYLQHQLANAHLEQGKYDESIVVAQRCMKESKKIRNKAYLFLGNLIILKSQIIQKKHEMALTEIKRIAIIAKSLQRPSIIKFIKFAQEIIVSAIDPFSVVIDDTDET